MLASDAKADLLKRTPADIRRTSHYVFHAAVVDVFE